MFVLHVAAVEWTHAVDLWRCDLLSVVVVSSGESAAECTTVALRNSCDFQLQDRKSVV